MSAPHVTGGAALLWSAVPGLTNCNVRALIRQTAADIGAPGRDEASGFGILDVRSAIDVALAGGRPTSCTETPVARNSHGVNGGGANDGAGFLLDAAGNDQYRAFTGGTNGGADNGSQGLLYDGSGNDTYVAGSYGTNGGVHSVFPAVGALIDAAGDDSYTGGSYGVNGGAFGDPGTFGGTGLLIDRAGSDDYLAEVGGVNGGSVRICDGVCVLTLPLTGSLVDAAGFDTYQDGEGGTGTDCSVIPKGSGDNTFGAQVDLPDAVTRPNSCSTAPL
jgi:subtilase family protein